MVNNLFTINLANLYWNELSEKNELLCEYKNIEPTDHDCEL